MWIILFGLTILLISFFFAVMILKAIEGQPSWLMNMSHSSSTDDETETSSSGATAAQSGSISWQQSMLNHVQSMGNSESEPTGTTPPMPDVQPPSTGKKKSKKDKKPTNRFELMDMDE